MTQQLRVCPLVSESGYLTIWQFPPSSPAGQPRYGQNGDLDVHPGDYVLVTWFQGADAFLVLLRLPKDVHGFAELVEATRRPHTDAHGCPACAWVLTPAYVVAIWDLSDSPAESPPGLAFSASPVPRDLDEAIAALPA